MVEKPTEGVCSGCGAEALEFYDDGSGRCMNCGRTFRWASEEEIKKDKSKKSSSRSRSSQQPRQRSSSRSEPSRKSSSRSKQSQQSRQRSSPSKSSRQASSSRSQPSRRTSEPSKRESRRSKSQESRRSKRTSSRKKKGSKAFLWIAVTGFIVMMVGYGLLFGLSAGDTLAEGGIDDVVAYQQIGMMLNYIGILIVGVGLVWGAATAEQLDDNIRSRMLMAMAILLGLFLSLTFFIMSMFDVLG